MRKSLRIYNAYKKPTFVKEQNNWRYYFCIKFSK